MRSWHWVFLACWQIATVVACGDDDDGGDGSSGGDTTSVDTGLTPSAKLSSLDDDDARQACMNTAHTFNTVLPDAKWEEVGCTLVGITYGGSVSECESLTSKCVQGEPIDGKVVRIETEIADESSCEHASASKRFGDCEATVADYESCESKLASEIKKRFTSVSCDAVKDVEAFQKRLRASVDLSKSPECEELRSKCPNLDLSGETDTEIDTGDEG